MRKGFIVAGLLAAAFISAPAHSQASVFGGYSAAVQQPTFNGFTASGLKKSVLGAVESQGFEVSVSFHAVGPFAAVLDYSNLNHPGNTQLFLAGVELRQRRTKTFQVFEQGLVGAARSSNTAGQTLSVGPVSIVGTAPAFAAGVGLDIHFGEYFALRPIQIRYLYAPVVGTNTHSQAQVSAGIVITF